MQILRHTYSRLSARALLFLAFSLFLSACAGGDATRNDMATTALPQNDELSVTNTPQDIEPVVKKAVAAVEAPSWEERLPELNRPEFSLNDITLQTVDLLLGPESLRRDEMAGHIRRYDGTDCQLYLVVFDGQIDHVEARDPKSGVLKNAEECGRGLARVASRQSRGSF